MQAILHLEDGTKIDGVSFGADVSAAGEVVFTTGMVGYPESLTDPSFAGQILVFTYPLIGNYGVPEKSSWESDKIHLSGVIVSSYNDTPSHHSSTQSLSDWLKSNNIPGIQISDTRFLAKKIRTDGVMRGKILIGNDVSFIDSAENLVARVSTKKIVEYSPSTRSQKSLTARGINNSSQGTVLMIDCGVKNNTIREFLQRGVKVIRVPWDYDPFTAGLKFDALFISNGPGDPKTVVATIKTVKIALDRKMPIFGICLGNQILALAAGGDTYKLKFGHRGQNQPCILENSPRCYLTTQNHGYAVGNIPQGFKQWFRNANDNTNEGIIHTKYPFMSVQFHPESTPGPLDTEWIFDYFLEKLKQIPLGRGEFSDEKTQ